MRNRNRTLTALLLPILVICLLLNITRITVHATETTNGLTSTKTEATEYETADQLCQIEFGIYFADNNETEVEPTAEQYQQNQFRCYTAENGEYLIAEYDETTGTYIFNGEYTTDKTAATVFTPGMFESHLNKVLITNIPVDNYIIEQIGVSNTYSALPDPVTLKVDPKAANVNGNAVEMTADNTLMFNITLVLEEDVKIFTDLTDGDHELPENTTPTINPIVIVLIVIAVILLILTIYPMFNNSDAETNKTQSKGTHHGKKK